MWPWFTSTHRPSEGKDRDQPDNEGDGDESERENRDDPKRRRRVPEVGGHSGPVIEFGVPG